MAFSIPNFKLYHRAQRSNVSALARQLFCKRLTYSINVAAIICNLYGASSVRRCITAPAWTIFASLVVFGSLVLICTRCPIRSGYNIYTLPYRSTSSQIKTLWDTCSTERVCFNEVLDRSGPSWSRSFLHIASSLLDWGVVLCPNC